MMAFVLLEIGNGDSYDRHVTAGGVLAPKHHRRRGAIPRRPQAFQGLSLVVKLRISATRETKERILTALLMASVFHLVA